MRVLLAMALVSWGLPTCSGRMTSNEDQWRFDDPSLVSQGARSQGLPYRILAGSTVCATPDAVGFARVDEASGLDLFKECVQVAAEGSVALVDDCFLVERAGVGAVTLHVAPGCFERFNVDLQDDRIEVQGVELSSLRPRSWSTLDSSIGPRDASGGDVERSSGTAGTFYVMGDQFARVSVRLVDDDDRAVAWPLAPDQLSLDGGRLRLIGRGQVIVSMPPGETSTLVATLPAGQIELLTVVGVHASDLKELQIVAPLGELPVDEDADRNDVDVPVLEYVDRVWAVYRHTDGSPVWGVPTAWEFYGGRLLKPHALDSQASMIELKDVCEPVTSGRFRVGLRATADLPNVDLTTKSLLRYRYPQATLEILRDAGYLDLEDPFVPEENCPQPGCSGCTSVGGASMLAWPLALLLVCFGRRRRS